MEQEFTAREILAQIENDFFKGVDLGAASKLKGSKRREFTLAQVERLLTEKHGPSLLALWLSDMFWTADKGRLQPECPNPLMVLKEQQTLTEEEMDRLRLILGVAGLCHDLSLYFPFDLKEAFGISKDSFSVANKGFVEWLTSTEYEHIAMHTAFIMKKQYINMFDATQYQPAQDALAELYSMEYHKLVRNPNETEIPPRDYVRITVDEIQRIRQHWQDGIRENLNFEIVKLHDEIFGVVPQYFDKDVLAAAQALYDYMDKELCDRLVLEEYNENALSWNEQPESVKRTWADVLGRFAEKVREVRSKYLDEDWVTDDSLAFGYLMAHAQQCGRGFWGKEFEEDL